jgi:hypothetical protein
MCFIKLFECSASLAAKCLIRGQGRGAKSPERGQNHMLIEALRNHLGLIFVALCVLSDVNDQTTRNDGRFLPTSDMTSLFL